MIRIREDRSGDFLHRIQTKKWAAPFKRTLPQARKEVYTRNGLSLDLFPNGDRLAIYSYGYNERSSNFLYCRFLHRVRSIERGTQSQAGTAQLPLINSEKLRNSLATLALAFSSIAL